LLSVELSSSDHVRALITQSDGPSVASGFTVGAAVVVAAEELVGFGVDGDEFAVAPGRISSGLVSFTDV
jgi:hypothetical protein